MLGTVDGDASRCAHDAVNEEPVQFSEIECPADCVAVRRPCHRPPLARLLESHSGGVVAPRIPGSPGVII